MAIGHWMKTNGESIYATQASPFEKTPWGRCTRKKITDGKTRLYLHVFNWPESGKLVVPRLAKQPVAASLLASGQPLQAVMQDQNIVISVPDQARFDRHRRRT